MSELKPDSEKKEERLSDKEKVNTEKTNAEELNAEKPNAEELNAEKPNAEKPNVEKLNEEKPNTEEIDEEPPAASEDEDFFFDDNKAYEARRAARLERRNKLRRRKKRLRIAGCIVVAAAAAIGIGIGFYGEELQNFVSEQQVKIAQMVKSADRKTEEEKTAQQTNAEAEAENAVTPEVQDTDGLSEEDKTLYRQAKYAAKQYDYDKAISMLQNSEIYQTSEKFQHAVKVYQKKKESCVSWPLDQVTHVFYHTLIKDTGKAFDGDYKSGDYDQVMTTIDEFNQITQSMYDKGYVMVSIYDMATADENGNMNAGEILLPPGKVPFVLSQDDVCYYHYMDGDGFATKLIVDEEGKIRNEYVEDDGSISVGDYDMVPLIDRFVEEHPDFSYRGAKGIVALTGYNGILGYRTDSSYETRPDDLDADKVKWLDEHPDFNLNTERENAARVAQAMKDEGWLFASHTWGHQNVSQISLERLQADTQKFKENVDPLIGGTDIIIFAFGADLTSVEDYSGEKFEYLKSQGYNYYCNVDSSQYFVQIRSNYFRQGRRNLDGYRMYYNPELLSDLFDGQLQEWYRDYRETDIHHRHVSHLYGLYPGNVIKETDQELKKACEISLNRRGSQGTGWCMVWKASLWARLKNGEKAFELLKNQVNLTHTTEVDMSGGGIYPNLFCAHPPFQIDGNFGFAAAISEMLLQSQNNDIELLPAIPEQWKRGQIKGIKARGGYTVDFSWKNGKVYYIKISALKEGNVIVRYNGQISRFFFKEGQNKVCLQKTGRK